MLVKPKKPMTSSSAIPKRLVEKRHMTIPQSPHLSTRQRARSSREVEDIDEDSENTSFKANPMPKFGPVQAPKPSVKKVTLPESPAFATRSRVASRKAFDAKVQEQTQQQAEEEEMRRKQREVHSFSSFSKTHPNTETSNVGQRCDCHQIDATGHGPESAQGSQSTAAPDSYERSPTDGTANTHVGS